MVIVYGGCSFFSHLVIACLLVGEDFTYKCKKVVME
jgi:hypothetical protein